MRYTVAPSVDNKIMAVMNIDRGEHLNVMSPQGSVDIFAYEKNESAFCLYDLGKCDIKVHRKMSDGKLVGLWIYVKPKQKKVKK